MKKIGMAIHAGAGPDSEFVQKHLRLYEEGLAAALKAGYKVLEKGGSAVNAVEASVRSMEDNYIFNAGRGSALNAKGEVEMYASIMDGKAMRAGAGCLLKTVKNPITFAKKILEEGKSVFLGGEEADATAQKLGLELEVPAYFITDLQVENYLKKRAQCKEEGIPFNPAIRGTVGAVAMDKNGNLAAGTSTGGTIFSQPGRIGDTSMIGVGTYANNACCAISCTGDGEVLIVNALAHTIFATREFKDLPMQETCDWVLHKRLKKIKGDMGVISIDKEGNIGIAYNSERMHRAWKSSSVPLQVKIYK
jgi:beta-aspartyl-peptidase (threonine type)